MEEDVFQTQKFCCLLFYKIMARNKEEIQKKCIVGWIFVAYDEDVNNLQGRRRCVEEDPKYPYVRHPVGWACLYAFRFDGGYPNNESTFY